MGLKALIFLINFTKLLYLSYYIFYTAFVDIYVEI